MKRLPATVGFLIVMLGTLAGCSLPTPPGAPATATEAAVVATPASANSIVADAIVVPDRSVDLRFDIGGTVAEVLVQEGDSVAAGAPLARLDTHDLALQVAQNQANLAQAQASYDKIAAGATPAAIAAQQAQVRNAQAQFDRARSGNSTAADIASAQAQLRAAQARLDALKHPAPANRSAAEFSVTAAQTTLAATQASASADKTNAELAMRQAGEDLTQAQASYATAKANWEYVQATGRDPANPSITGADGKRKENKLNDVQKRQYYATFVQDEAGLRSAEQALTQAQVTYDHARQAEVTQNQQAEAALANAQQQQAALKNPSANDIAQAQASVDAARAAVQKAQQGGTKADIAAAQAVVDQNQANLAQLTAPSRPVDLAEAQSRIDAAQVALQLAERQVEKATLRAPFAGTVAERALEVGQLVSSGMGTDGHAPFVLADFDHWKIQTDNLNERDIVRLHGGSPVQLTFDALPDLTLAGKVATIKPRGSDRYGDTTYTVTVLPDRREARLRWNMSASVAITATTP